MSNEFTPTTPLHIEGVVAPNIHHEASTKSNSVTFSIDTLMVHFFTCSENGKLLIFQD